METIGSRIKKLRKEKKITQKDLGIKLAISDAAVNLWEKDVNTPKLENMFLLADILDTTVEYLLNGNDVVDSNIKDFRPVSRLLPVLTHVQCGRLTNVSSISHNEIEKWLPAPPNSGKNSFYLITQGISNSPDFNDGDYVCIDPDIPFHDVQTGEMIVVCQDDEATFKALVREFNTLYLKALNLNFQPNIIPLGEDFIYKGSYVGKFTPRKKFL